MNPELARMVDVFFSELAGSRYAMSGWLPAFQTVRVVFEGLICGGV
jgi:hypothetical protein